MFFIKYLCSKILISLLETRKEKKKKTLPETEAQNYFRKGNVYNLHLEQNIALDLEKSYYSASF